MVLKNEDAWKLFCGVEAIREMLMFGWSASFLFGTVSQFYKVQLLRHEQGSEQASYRLYYKTLEIVGLRNTKQNRVVGRGKTGGNKSHGPPCLSGR